MADPAENASEGGRDAPAPLGDAQKRRRPSKALPTDRITFSKQLDLLRAYGLVYEHTGKAVQIKDAAEMVKMAPPTASLANAFFLESGFLQKVEGALFQPCPEVVAFAKAFEWNQVTAAQSLGAVMAGTWFGRALIPRARFAAVDEDGAIQLLAMESSASTDYRGQVRVLLDYLQAAGSIEREGGMVRARSAVTSAPPPPDNSPAEVQQMPSPPEPPQRSSVSTSFIQPTHGLVQFQVSVKVDMAEFAGWEATRIAAFFAGIAQVLAAKGSIEKGAA